MSICIYEIYEIQLSKFVLYNVDPVPHEFDEGHHQPTKQQHEFHLFPGSRHCYLVGFAFGTACKVVETSK